MRWNPLPFGKTSTPCCQSHPFNITWPECTCNVRYRRGRGSASMLAPALVTKQNINNKHGLPGVPCHQSWSQHACWSPSSSASHIASHFVMIVKRLGQLARSYVCIAVSLETLPTTVTARKSESLKLLCLQELPVQQKPNSTSV